MSQAPFAENVIYRSADYREPVSAPLYINEWAQLLDQCRVALDRRRAAYPAMIAERKIKPDLAARDIAAWEVLVAQWTWIVEGPAAEGAVLPDLMSLADRVAAVDLALVRVDQQIARGNRTHDILLQCHLNQALRWHLERERRVERTAAFYADLNRAIAADRAAKGLPASAVQFLMTETPSAEPWSLERICA